MKTSGNHWRRLSQLFSSWFPWTILQKRWELPAQFAKRSRLVWSEFWKRQFHIFIIEKKKEKIKIIHSRTIFIFNLSTGWWSRVEHDCWNKRTFSPFCERFERRVLEEIVRQENLLGPTHEIRGPGQTIRLERIIQVRN